MKFNKLILNYVPNCQTGRAWAGNTKDATGILCKQREGERRRSFVVPPRVINVSAMDCQTDEQTATAWAICLATEVENKTVNLLRPNWPIGAA